MKKWWEILGLCPKRERGGVNFVYKILNDGTKLCP